MRPSSPTSVAAPPASGFEPFLEFLYDGPDNIPPVYHTRTTYVRSSIRSLVVETNVSSAKGDELLREYAGREDELLKNLEKMKLEQEKEAEIMEEVKALVEETKAPKSPEELMAAYKGRYGDLLKYIRQLKADQATKASIRSLVVETNVGEKKSAEELLETYRGKEDVLLRNLSKMKAKQERDAETMREINALIEENADAKDKADMLMGHYRGREKELLKQLSKHKMKKEKEAETRASVRALVAQTSVRKSADELLGAYEGREEVLLKNLSKMKEKEEGEARTKEEIDALLEQNALSGDKAAMLKEHYVGREEELLKQLSRMKVERAKDEEKDEEIKALIAQCDIDKSPDELMKVYEGKEDKLLKNLRRMSSTQGIEKAKEAEKAEEIKSLVAQCNIDKSPEELMKTYEGKEDVLLKNLRRMSSSQVAEKEKDAETAEEIRSLIARCDIDKSPEELMKAYEGKEDVLLKNLRRMSSSKGASKPEVSTAPNSPSSPASAGGANPPRANQPYVKPKSYNQLIAEKKAQKKAQRLAGQ